MDIEKLKKFISNLSEYQDHFYTQVDSDIDIKVINDDLRKYSGVIHALFSEIQYIENYINKEEQ